MTDENTFVMPDAWLDALHPRRDRPHVPEPSAPDPSAVAEARSQVDAMRDRIEGILALPGTEPEIADAARAHLRGEATPLGAAAVERTVGVVRELQDHKVDGMFSGAWVAEHGVAFAAAAFTASVGLSANERGIGWLPPDARLGPRPRRAGVEWLRRQLAAAPDDVYAAAVEGLDRHRGGHLQKLVAAYLAPTREDWVEELCADPATASFRHRFQRWMLFCSMDRPDQAAAVPADFFDHRLDVIVSLIAGVGPEPVVPLLAEALDQGFTAKDADVHLGVLCELPVDDAFRALAERLDRPLVPPAALAVARRFPVRALRVLPESRSPQADALLAAHVRTHPDLAAEVLPALPAESRDAVKAILDANVRPPSLVELPPLLTEPPWTRPGKKAKPVVIKDLPAPGTRAVVWAPGEREAWAARMPGGWDRRLGERVLKGWVPHGYWDYYYADGWAEPLVANLELDAHDPVLALARHAPARRGRYAMPLLSDEIARTMADWLVRLRTAGKTARAWFDRHGTAAAPALIPDALGKAGPARRAAEAALRFIADRHGRAPVVEAARVHGDRAAAAIEEMLATDPLDVLPGKVPDVGWADPRVLPQILLRDRAHALPDEAAGHVLTMLAMSKPDEPYAGVRVVRELCDPASLAEFGWALFRHWELTGAPATEKWAFTQLALTGDDETCRRLAPVIRAWPGEGGHAKAVAGLDVLAAIGSETALMHLHSISQRVKFKGLKTKAQEKIEEVAADLGLSAEQLADRVVPDFGLDASGRLTLDYGPRRFVIGFDELLRPTIADEDGKVRKSLPKPGAKDDPELAPAAYKRFSDLKKDVRTVASDQLRRLETALVTGRRWPVGEFREFLAAHPLVGHLVRRLVWRVEDGTLFRVAEDGTYTDADDDTITLPEAGEVRIAHPVHLGEGEVKAWTELFADYEILQPFEQLARPVHALTAEERETGRLARFEGARVPVDGLLGLVRRGWERGAPMDAGIEHEFGRTAPGCGVVIDLDPGIVVGAPYEQGDQVLAKVRMTEGSGSERDPVAVSEVLADLVRLTSEAEKTR